MGQMRLDYPLGVLCRIMGVSACGFYASCSRGPSQRAQEEGRLEIEIRAAHQRTRGTYGPERLQRDLAAHGVRIGVHMTYVPTDEGWLYRVGHKDLCTRKIVGHAMGERMTRNLVIESLLRAVETTGSCIGLLHHSDKGSQYCSHEYRKMLDRLGMKTSMSGTGNCYDNAPMESFWATLKTELVFHRRFATRQQAIREITEYIEVFYNRQRIQKKLDYLSPVAFERRFYEQRMAA